MGLEFALLNSSTYRSNYYHRLRRRSFGLLYVLFFGSWYSRREKYQALKDNPWKDRTTPIKAFSNACAEGFGLVTVADVTGGRRRGGGGVGVGPGMRGFVRRPIRFFSCPTLPSKHQHLGFLRYLVAFNPSPVFFFCRHF